MFIVCTERVDVEYPARLWGPRARRRGSFYSPFSFLVSPRRGFEPTTFPSDLDIERGNHACYFLTLDELLLPLDDLVGEGLLLVVLQNEKIAPSDLVLLEQVVRLHLDLLDLQLVDLAEQGQDLALLLRADPLRKLLGGGKMRLLQIGVD